MCNNNFKAKSIIVMNIYSYRLNFSNYIKRFYIPYINKVCRINILNSVKKYKERNYILKLKFKINLFCIYVVHNI